MSDGRCAMKEAIYSASVLLAMLIVPPPCAHHRNTDSISKKLAFAVVANLSSRTRSKPQKVRLKSLFIARRLTSNGERILVD
jgi:hypothetical protein